MLYQQSYSSTNYIALYPLALSVMSTTSYPKNFPTELDAYEILEKDGTIVELKAPKVTLGDETINEEESNDQKTVTYPLPTNDEPARCQYCNAELPPNAKFCPHCEKELPHKEQKEESESKGD